MTRLRRMLVAMTLGGLAGAVALVFFHAIGPAIVFDMRRDLPSIARGFHPIEQDPKGLTFAWTRERAEIALPGLDRRSPWTAKLRVRGGRADVSTLPEVRIAVDGDVRETVRSENVFRDVTVDIPARPTERGAVITVHVSSTFVPGPGDTRALGVMVDEVSVAPAGDTVTLAPRRTLGGAIIACALFGLAFGAIGLTTAPAVGAVVLIAIGQGAVLSRGIGPYMPYGGNMAWFALGLVVMLVGGTWIAERAQGPTFRNTARFVAAFAAATAYLKLLVLLHPAMPVGDAVFQAHRLQWVMDGRFYFTSVAPGGYEFPYAVGLYVAALPFTLFGAGVPFLVDVLRVVVAIADALAGLLLYLMVVRTTGDRIAGAMAAGVFHLVPLNTAVQVTGNLTNSFAQSWFLVVMALVMLGVVRAGATRGIVLATCAALAASLSHTSTFAILVPVLLATAVLFWWRGSGQVRASALAVAIVACLVTVLAVLVYYGHFGETYRGQVARIAAELGRPAAESDPGGRSVTARVWLVPHYVRTYFGIPVTILAIAGAAWLWRRPHRDRLALATSGWAAGCGAFLLLGVLTPVDMRHYLAFFPAMAILAGLGAAWLWRAGPVARGASVALLAAVVARGVWQWLLPLTNWAQ
jgi:hypothetical protein